MAVGSLLESVEVTLSNTSLNKIGIVVPQIEGLFSATDIASVLVLTLTFMDDVSTVVS